MAKRNRRHHGVSLFSSRVMLTVSVTFVLLLLATTAVIGVASRRVIDTIRSEIGFVVVISENASEAEINSLKKLFNNAPYTASYTYASPEQVMDNWIAMTGVDESGDSPELFDVNPFLPEINVNVKADYASADSLEKITGHIASLPAVDKAIAHTDLVSDISSTINNVTLILLAVACALLIISLVLINNTVRLSIYSRRFLIHTMKLVGATDGFIRRPFVKDNIVNGLVAGLGADILLALLLAYAYNVDPSAIDAFSWIDYAIIAGATVVTGIIVCVMTAIFSTNTHLRQSYDDMFRY